MQKKNTSTELILSIIVLIICLAMLLGLVFAWFTYSASTNVNTILASNLDIEIDHTNANIRSIEMSDNQTIFLKMPKVVIWNRSQVLCHGKLSRLRMLSIRLLNIPCLLIYLGITQPMKPISLYWIPIANRDCLTLDGAR